MNVLLRRASLRYLRVHWAQTTLAVLGVAVGVAAWVSVQSASRAAQQAFEVSTQQAFGIATHQILPLDRTLADELYGALRRKLPGVVAAPVLSERVRVEIGGQAQVMHLVGIDPLAETALRRGTAAATQRMQELIGMVGAQDAVVVPKQWVERWAGGVGQHLDVLHGDRRHSLSLQAQVDEAQLPLGEDTLLVDIAAAQRVLHAPGRLSRIDLVLTAEQVAPVAALLPADAELVSTLARSEAVSDMTRAYRLNLQALALLTLLVGLLLVYSTLTHLVVQRRDLFHRLYALGTTGRQLRRLVLGEALLLGLCGGVVGAIGGTVLAGRLVELMAGNITDLYFRLQVQALTPQPMVMFGGLCLGLLASAAGGAAPALETRARGSGPRRTLGRELTLAIAAAVCAGGLLVASSGSLIIGFAGLFLVAVAGALLAPAALQLLAGVLLVVPGIGGRLLSRMTVRESVASLPRTRIALASLVLAVATVVALDTMVANFRDSVAHWLDDSVDGELVISLDSAVYPDPREAALDELARRIEQLTEVEAVTRMRFQRLREGADVLLLRAAEHIGEVPGLVAGSGGEAFDRGDGVLVSEPLARRRGLSVGALLRLNFPTGAKELPVLGVYRDYLSDRGVVLMSLEGFQRWTGDFAIGSFAVHSRVPDAMLPRVSELLAQQPPGVVATASSQIRDSTLAIFDRTFVVTHVLKLLVAGVAMLGMLGALLAWTLERSWLRRSLRSVGLTSRELHRQVILETGTLGLATTLVALPLGVMLAGLLIFVINIRAFGWGMQFAVLAAPLWQGALLAVGTALLAGLLAGLGFAREGSGSVRA